MKLRIVGASNFANRAYEACGPFQWAREFLKNSLEAGASRIEFGIEWEAVETLGVYRRTIIDNGIGMSGEELLRFFSTLGEGGKKIGGLHDNFGIGGKIASLPWNPNGVVVISFKESKAAMIYIVLNEETGDYELMEFRTEKGISCVIDPAKIDWQENDVHWDRVAPAWIKGHGTAIVLLGSANHKDTILGNGSVEESRIHGLPIYINSRFWDLTRIKVTVIELRSDKRETWPKCRAGSVGQSNSGVNNRRIMGARHYIHYRDTGKGKMGSTGQVSLADGKVHATWFLWKGERPPIHGYAKETGFIAVKYQDELFSLTSRRPSFRAFGISVNEVQRNLTIILEPSHYNPTNGRWGIHPDQSRNRLIFTGDSDKGVDLPLLEWGNEFAHRMPSEILEAIHKARGNLSGSIEDEEYRKRLQDKFGDRWKTSALMMTNNSKSHLPGTRETILESISTDIPPQKSKIEQEKKAPAQMRIRMKAHAGGENHAVERKIPADVPRYRYCGKEEFEKPSHIAVWAPNDADGPTVLINQDATVIQESIKYHIDQYPLVYADEVRETVMAVYGEVAVSKIAHSQKLAKVIAQEELDREYRSEQALTFALMGLLAEESVIGQRLLRLGRKNICASK